MPIQEHHRSLVLRSVVIADDSPLIDLTDATYSNALHANATKIIPGVTFAEIFFFGTTGSGTDADTNVNLYGWFADSTPATYMLGTWSLTLGTQVATTLPDGTTMASGLAVDTLAADADYWGVIIRDSAPTNHIARLALDLRGLRYIYAEFVNVLVETNEMDSVAAYYRAY